MRRRGLIKVYGTIGAALMIALAVKEPMEIHASFNTAVSGEAETESGEETETANFPEESDGMESGSSGESVSGRQEDQTEQQDGMDDSPEMPIDTAVGEGTLPEDAESNSAHEGDTVNPAGSASIVGGSYVELEEEIRYEGTVIENIERSGGTFAAGTICSTEPIVYSIRFNGGVQEGAYVRYRAGELEQSIPIVDNAATVTLSGGAGDHLQMWYVEGETENLFLETHVVIEQQAPEISYKRVTKEDGKQYARVSITESGENMSGIKECSFMVDGVAYISEEITTLEVHAMPGGEEVPVRQEVDILLEGQGDHEIQAEIFDNAGNPASVVFSMKGLPEGVASVILPTSFRIAIRPYEVGENEQIYSDDVVICNKSDFPVEVEVSSIEVEVNHVAPWGEIVTKRVEVNGEQSADVLDLEEGTEVPLKDCVVNFKLRQFEKEPLILPLVEGNNESVTRFSLEAGEEGTNPQELMGQRYADTVRSSDYAIINICGDLGEGSEDLWRSEDLVVRLVFKFHRQELSMETEGQ